MASLKELELTVVWELCWNRWSEALVLLHVGPFMWLFGPPHSMAYGFQEEAIQEKGRECCQCSYGLGSEVPEQNLFLPLLVTAVMRPDKLKRRISFIFNRKIICTYREEKINCGTSRV